VNFKDKKKKGHCFYFINNVRKIKTLKRGFYCFYKKNVNSVFISESILRSATKTSSYSPNVSSRGSVIMSPHDELVRARLLELGVSKDTISLQPTEIVYRDGGC